MFKAYRTVLVGGLLLLAASRVFASGADCTEALSLQQHELATSQSDKTIGEKVESYVVQRGMIRRDATKALFIPKGQWMLGGQVGWNQWNNDNLSYVLLNTLDIQDSTL